MITPFVPRIPAMTQDELNALIPAAGQIMRAAVQHGQAMQFTHSTNGIKATLTVCVEKEDETL